MSNLRNHVTTAHSPSTIEKIKVVPLGGKLSNSKKLFAPHTDV
jgi:hypothetical protein